MVVSRDELFIGINATILHTGSSLSFWSNQITCHYLFLYVYINIYSSSDLLLSYFLNTSYMTVLQETRLALFFWWVTTGGFLWLTDDPCFLQCTSCSWPLLTDCWFCCRSSAGQRALWIDTSPPHGCWWGAPHTQQQESPGTRGFPDNEIKPTHSLSASDMVLYSPPPPTPFLCWLVTMKFWSMSITEQIKKRKLRFKWLINQQPISGSVLLCFNYSGWGIYIGSEWHPIISCCKIGVNWINLMSWSLIKIPLSWCQGEFNGGCPYLYVVLTCEWWFLHGLPLRNCFHSSSTYQEKKVIHHTWYMSDKINSERNTLLLWQESSFFLQLQSNL